LCHVAWKKFTDISEVLAASIIRVMGLITLMMKAASTSEMLINFYQTTQCFLFLSCSTGKNKQSLLASEIEQVNANEATENKSKMELAKVLAFTFNHNTGAVSCEVCLFSQYCRSAF
jgi:Tfp pilus assembly pilus retraction ATPase PilT